MVLSVKTKFYEKSYILYSCVSNFHLEHKKKLFDLRSWLV